MVNAREREEWPVSDAHRDFRNPAEDAVQCARGATRNYVEVRLKENTPHVRDRGRNTQDVQEQESYHRRTVEVSAQPVRKGEEQPPESDPKEDAIREALGRGEIPQVLAESWHLVDPASPEARNFQEIVRTFAETLYREDPSKIHLPHYEFKHHDFQEEPVRFLLSKHTEPNAWFVRYSNPPAIVFTEGFFSQPPSSNTIPPIRSPHDLAAVLGHEMTHLKMRKVYGNVPDSKFEEGLAFALPLIVMSEHGRKMGLNPERVLDADGKAGLFNALNQEGKKQRSWTDYIDAHPVTETIHAIVSNTLAYLRKEMGELTPPTGELRDFAEDHELLRTIRHAEHHSYLERMLQEHPAYGGGDTAEKLSTILAVIRNLDHVYAVRIKDIAREIRKLHGSVTSGEHRRLIDELANATFTLAESGETANAIVLYSALAAVSDDALQVARPPLGRLKPLNRAIRSFIVAVEAYDGKDAPIVQAARNINELLEGHSGYPGEPLSGTGAGRRFLQEIRWEQFPFPDVDTLTERRNAHDVWGDEEEDDMPHYPDDEEKQWRHDVSVSDDEEEACLSWGNDRDDNDEEGADQSKESELHVSWEPLRQLAADHADVAKTCTYLGLTRDPLVLGAVFRHENVVLDLMGRVEKWGRKSPMETSGISPGPQDGSTTIDHLVFNDDGAVVSVDFESTSPLIAARRRGFAAFLSDYANRLFPEAASDPKALKTLKIIMEQWHSITAGERVESSLACLDGAEKNLPLFLQLNQHTLQWSRNEAQLFLSKMERCGRRAVRNFYLSSDGRETIRRSLQHRAMPFLSTVEESAFLEEPLVGEGRGETITNPYLTFLLRSEVFSDKEKYTLLHDFLIVWRADDEQDDARTPLTHFESISQIFDTKLASRYLQLIRPILSKVGQDYEFPFPSWSALLTTLGKSVGGDLTLTTSALYCEGIRLLAERTPTIKQAVEFVRHIGPERIAGSKFQHNLREALSPAADRFARELADGRNTIARAAERWQILSKAELLFPEASEQILSILTEKIVTPRQGSASAWKQCAHLTEKLLTGTRIQNPEMRSRLIEAWSTSLLCLFGPDTGQPQYAERIRAATDSMAGKAHRLDRGEILSALAKRLQTQQPFSLELQHKVYEVDPEALHRFPAYGILSDAAIDVIRKSGEHRRATLDFLTTPLSEETCAVLVEKIEEALLVGQELARGSAISLTSEPPDPHEAMIFRYRRQLTLNAVRRFYENFWASPLEMRAVLVRELLISQQESTTHVDRETFDYVVSRMFPGGGLYDQEVRFFIRAYIDALPHYQKHICLSAMMTAAEKKGTRAMRIGETLAFFLDNMGPAEIKVGQAAHSHPLVPEDIRRDLKRLKYRTDEPERWEVTEWVESIRPDLEQKCSTYFGQPTVITRIGDIRGSASINVVVEVELNDGNGYLLSLVRPYALERGRSGFHTIGRMIDNLETTGGSVILQTLRELIHRAGNRLDIETDCSIAPRQYAHAGQIYNGVTVLMDGEEYSFTSPTVIASGENYFLMTKVEGEHFTELPDTSTEEYEEKRKYAMAILCVELNNMLRGHFDCDRHGGNIKVRPAERAIGHFDFKAMALREWSDVGYRQFAHLLRGIRSGGQTVHQFLSSLMEQEQSLRGRLQKESQQVDPFVTEVQKGLLTGSEYTQCMDPNDLMRVVISAFLNGIHPAMQETFLEAIAGRVPAPFKEVYDSQVQPTLRQALETGELTPALQGLLPAQMNTEDVIRIRRPSHTLRAGRDGKWNLLYNV